MKRILIVGAGGQIGSELTVYLRSIYGGSNVVATDMRECRSLAGDGPFEVLNALDATAMASVVARHRIDTIFNLVALLSAVGERNPQMAWNVNMGALNNSLEVARQHHCALFTPSSIGAFGPSSPKDKTPQDTIMQPTTIYGICKVTGELLGNYYHHKYGVDTRSVRFPGIISSVTLPGEIDPPQQLQPRVDELHARDHLRRDQKASARLHDGLQRRSREEGDRRELAQFAGRHLCPRGVGLETRMGPFAHDRRHAGAHPREAGCGISEKRRRFRPLRQLNSL